MLDSSGSRIDLHSNWITAVHNQATTPLIAKVGTFLVFGAVIFYIAVGRSFTWLAPPLADTQLYAYVGNAWLHGDLPYIRVWEMKPPGIFAVNAAVFAFFPKSFGALAVLEGLFMF